jgi:hypothetical protein
MPYSFPTPLSEDSGGGSEENASELEIDILLVFEVQAKPLAPAPSSPRSRRSTEPSHSQIY